MREYLISGLILLLAAGCDDDPGDAADDGSGAADAVASADESGLEGDANGGGVDASDVEPTPDAAAEADMAVRPPPNPPVGCDDLDPCGGDPVGTWTWVAWCDADEPEEGPEACPDAELASTITPTGTVDLAADGTFTVDADYTAHATARFPSACVPGACDAFGAEIDADSPWTCAVDGDVCACAREQVIDGDSEGTWTVEEAGVVTIDVEGDALRPMYFCVDGETLRLLDVGADGTDPVFVLER